jgi:hypothetical protein
MITGILEKDDVLCFSKRLIFEILEYNVVLCFFKTIDFWNS